MLGGEKHLCLKSINALACFSLYGMNVDAAPEWARKSPANTEEYLCSN